MVPFLPLPIGQVTDAVVQPLVAASGLRDLLFIFCFFGFELFYCFVDSIDLLVKIKIAACRTGRRRTDSAVGVKVTRTK